MNNLDLNEYPSGMEPGTDESSANEGDLQQFDFENFDGLTLDDYDPRPVPTTDPVAFAGEGTSVDDMSWPVITKDGDAMLVSYERKDGSIVGSKGRRFLADRSNGRYHVGIDLFCREGDTVTAILSGRITNLYKFYKAKSGEDTYCIIVEHNDFVVNYGEVRGNSLKTFGLKIGSDIEAGGHIGFVSSTGMLHFEAYVSGTMTNHLWMKSGKRPLELLNPSRVLFRLAGKALGVS